ncbi:cellulose binding domain-containing protein [Sphaerisporangium rhizosphaerae]|uniref:Cellulose binding domain-containing protein n=1 Tax=Sphaerisporangium rhizosphaerae TaxID=2269375 RepID=A0ABW2PEK9_9ACTN
MSPWSAAGGDTPRAGYPAGSGDSLRAGPGAGYEDDFPRVVPWPRSEDDLSRVGPGPSSEGDPPRVGPGPRSEDDILRVGLAPGGDERSGGPATEGPHDGGGRRRGRRRGQDGEDRPKPRRGRLAALSAVAVVTAITTAVIGVKLSSGQVDLVRPPDCPKGQVCAAIAPGKPQRQDTPPSDTETPDTGAPSDEASASPSAGSPSSSSRRSSAPTSGASRPPAHRTPQPSARPTPERTRTTPTGRPSPQEDTADPTPDPEETDITTSPEATPEADDADPLVAPGRVAVDFGVSAVTPAGYTGRLTITNTGAALDGWSVRVPVGGEVTGADGAEWTQKGDLLVLSSAATLGEGETVVVSFTADGDSASPETCQLTGGSCRLRTDDAFSSEVAPEISLQ